MEYSADGTYKGATFQLGDFSDLDTASKGYKNSKSVPGRVMIFETFEKFFKIRINFWESFQKLGWHIPVGRSFLKSVFHAHASPTPTHAHGLNASKSYFLTKASSLLWPWEMTCYSRWRGWLLCMGSVLAWVAC